MFDIIPILQKYYSPNEPVLIACSTGPDSMFLLYKLLETSYKKNIVACYFNHHLRGESDDEEAFLIELGKKLDFKVEVASGDIAQIQKQFYPGKGIEEVAREKRYQFFSAVGEIYGTKKIMTAHHLDDKIETFFFNLARGSKLTGLINMTESYGNIIRPLLGMQKSEILEYLDERGLEYKIDKTNAQNIYTRNYLRNEIVPKFYEVNSNFKQNIAQTLSYFEDVKSHIDAQINGFLGGFPDGEFRLKAFFEQSEFLQKEIIREVFYRTNNFSTIGLSESNIAEILKFMRGKNNKTHKHIQLLYLFKDGDTLYYSKKMPD